MSQDSINYERLSENFWQGKVSSHIVSGERRRKQAEHQDAALVLASIKQSKDAERKGGLVRVKTFIREKLLKLIANHTKNRIAAATNRFNSNHIQISVINERFLGGGKKFGELFSDMLTM